MKQHPEMVFDLPELEDEELEGEASELSDSDSNAEVAVEEADTVPDKTDEELDRQSDGSSDPDPLWVRDFDLDPIDEKQTDLGADNPVAWDSGDGAESSSDDSEGEEEDEKKGRDEEPIHVAPSEPFFPFPNQETAKFAVLITTSRVSLRTWQKVLDTLHSGPFNVANLPRTTRLMSKYLRALPTPKVVELKVKQVVHDKRQKKAALTLNEFQKPRTFHPLQSYIRLKYLSILSAVAHYCASPGLAELFAFEWSSSDTFQEYTDCPLHKEYYKFRGSMSFIHGEKEYRVGEFVQINTDNHHMYRIDSISYEKRPEDRNGPVIMPMYIQCTAFLVAKFWRQHQATPRPYGVEDMDVIQIEDGFVREFKPDLISRKWFVLHDRDRPPEQLRRPALTTYCGHTFYVDAQRLDIYVPLDPVFTPPEVKNGAYNERQFSYPVLFGCAFAFFVFPFLMSWCLVGSWIMALVCRCVGVLVCWCVGVLVCWCVGVLVCWCVGVGVGVLVLVCWCVGVLVCWCVDVLVLVCWCVVCWCPGVLV